MGTVKTMRNIINQNLFGHLSSIKINFGDIYYKFDGFRSEKKESGGGIFFEGGSHWIDTVLFTTSAKDIKNFNLKKKKKIIWIYSLKEVLQLLIRKIMSLIVIFI